MSIPSKSIYDENYGLQASGEMQILPGVPVDAQ